MKVKIITSVLAIVFIIGNTGSCFAKKTFKNVIEDKETNTTTISFYDGSGDVVSTPLRQYTIKYSDQNQPVEKVLYLWDIKNSIWVLSEKYEYLYDAAGHPEAMKHCEWDKKANAWSHEVEYEFYLLDINKELLSVNDIK